MKKIIVISDDKHPLNSRMAWFSGYYLILIDSTLYWVNSNECVDECLVIPFLVSAKEFDVEENLPGILHKRLNHYYNLHPEKLLFSSKGDTVPSITINEIKQASAELLRLSCQFSNAEKAKITNHAMAIAKTLCEAHRYADLEIHCRRFKLSLNQIMDTYSPVPHTIVVD